METDRKPKVFAPVFWAIMAAVITVSFVAVVIISWKASDDTTKDWEEICRSTIAPASCEK